MKNLTVIVLLILVVSCSSPRAKLNEENVKKIEVDMNLVSVLEVMGLPDEISISPYRPSEFDFQYSSPSGYGDDFHIFISRTDSTVLRVAKGD